MKVLCLWLGLFLPALSWAQYQYPTPKKITQSEFRFGQWIVDEFKWMENASDPDLWLWVEEQKELTSSVLDPSSFNSFYQELKTLKDYKEQAERQETKKLLANSTEPALRLQTDSIVPEKKESDTYVLKYQSVHGGDLGRLKVHKKDGNELVEILLVKFYTLIKWETSDQFLFISDLDERLGGGHPGLFRHKVGDHQSEDTKIYQSKDSKASLDAFVVNDKVYIWEMNTETEKGFVAQVDLKTGKLHNQHQVEGTYLGKDDSTSEVLFLTFANANKGEIKKLRLGDGKISTMIKEQDFVIESVNKVKAGRYVITGHWDAAGVLAVFNHEQSKVSLIPSLSEGTFSFSKTEEEKAIIIFQSYSIPKQTYSLNVDTLEINLINEQKYPHEVAAQKIHYTASNSQKAAMWVITKRGLKLSPKTPMLLYGYGGFDLTILPTFNTVEIIPWLEKGGALTVVSLPGSLAYGKAWNKLAKRSGRVHSFDSFAAAGKELIARGYTSSEKLGMFGASNGGLLVAGTLQRHPELFKAAIPQVGVMDLYNFPLFSAGKYWTWEYGNPFLEKDFKEIKDISPYHNLRSKNYPAVMVMTAEFDDRVVPMHSFKYLARMQEVQQSDAPILLYMKEWGGHSRLSGSEKQNLNFHAAVFTFFAQQLGL